MARLDIRQAARPRRSRRLQAIRHFDANGVCRRPRRTSNDARDNVNGIGGYDAVSPFGGRMARPGGNAAGLAAPIAATSRRRRLCNSCRQSVSIRLQYAVFRIPSHVNMAHSSAPHRRKPPPFDCFALDNAMRV